MPGWLQNRLKDVASDLADDVVEKVSGALDAMDLGDVGNSLKETGIKSNTLAKETVELCRSTEAQSTRMMEFCNELKTTITGLQGTNVDPDSFDTIQELLSGDKVKTAMSLAKDMNQQAVLCVDKSVAMVTMMEDTMNNLPCPLQSAIDKAIQDDDSTDAAKHDEAFMSTLDRDVSDIEECLSAMKALNLCTALEVGLRAFEQLSSKAQVSRVLFDKIRGYSDNVANITDAFKEFDVTNIVKQVKDLWKCLKMAGVIRTLAEGLGSLIKLVINLFEETSTKVAGLWQALAFAKDCMKDCIDHASQAKTLCLKTKDKSTTLIDRSTFVRDKMGEMGDLNAASIGAFQELSNGKDINEAIGIANEMDGLVLECAAKAISMVDRVREGFRNLPDMITADINEDDAGTTEEDPAPADVESNIIELETSRGLIEEADVFKAVQAGTRGFSDVTAKVMTVKELLAVLEKFTETCLNTFQSFMGVWDINSAVDKIKEMCRIVKLGEMMKQFADQIKRLLLAVIELMKAAINKFANIDTGDIKENAAAMLGQAGKMVQELDMDDFSNVVGGKLGSFFKKN